MQVAELDDWTPQAVLDRGLKLLSWMEQRWCFHFKSEEQKIDIGLIFPIAAYLGVWNLSIKLVGIEVPTYVALISVVLGVGFFAIAAVCLNMIPKERIASSTK